VRALPLYADNPTAVLEREPARQLDRACTRCEMHDTVRSVCLSGEGEPGGLLVVGESPGRDEDAIGRPFVGASGRELRRMLAAHWRGPVAIDNAIRCAPGRREVKEKHLDACRGFLAATLAEAKPTRVVTLGAWAARAVTGRSISLFGSRRAYSYLFGQSDDPVPVFHVLHPASALRNRFILDWFRSDLRWALTCAPPPPAPIFAAARIIETEADAEQAVRELSRASWSSFDVETAGVIYTRSFRLLSVAACARGSSASWVWDVAALADPGARRVLAEWLGDPTAKKIGQNGKYDTNAVLVTLGARVRGLVGDTRLWRKLLEPEGEGSLDKMAELVGMGGTKEEARRSLEEIIDRVSTALSTERMLEKRATTRPLKGATWPKMSDARTIALAWLQSFELAEPELTAVIRQDPSEWGRWAYGLLDLEDRPKLLRYNARDAVSTSRLGEWLEPQLAAVPELDRVRRLVVDRAAHAVTRIEEWGVAVDVQAIQAFDFHLSTGIGVLKKRIDTCAASHGLPDFSPDSPLQGAKLLFEKLGLKSDKKTVGGSLSTDKAVLESLASKHPFPKDLVEYRRLTKLKGTYAEGMLGHVRPDGNAWRIHPSILLDGARSGRTSCIAGWCPVRTQRGDVPIRDVVEGDMVWTHRRRWRRVRRAFSQGVRPTIEMRLSSGDVLTCTSDHRLLSWAGAWKEAIEYAGESGMGGGERPVGGGALPQSGEPDLDADRGAAGYARGERLGGAAAALAVGGLRRAEVGEVQREQDGGQEPDAGQERLGAPQLEGRVRGRTRLPDGALGRSTAAGARRGDDAGAGGIGAADADGGTPHRRGPDEQRAGQPCARDALGASEDSLLAGEGLEGVVCAKVQAGRSLEVYDLTVDEDESFLVCGVFAHNCQDPNLQNIPRTTDEHGHTEGKMARDIFTASAGGVLISLDYSQLELRIAAALSQDPDMIAIFAAGVDYHLRTAQLISKTAWGIPPEKVEKRHRDQAKIINFAMLYGMGDAALAAKCGCSVNEARRIKEAILGKFKRLAAWIQDCLIYSQKTGLTWTWWAGERARRRPLWQIGDHDDARRVVAEHGSVNCLDAETEALTRRGWVRGFDLLRDDELLTKNAGTGALEWQPMTDLKLWPDYEGPVVEFKSRSFHAVSTPEHRWLVTENRSGATHWTERTTRTLSPWGDHRIHRTGDYRPALTSGLTPDEAELLGWFVTDGFVRPPKHDGPAKVARGRTYRKPSRGASLCQSASGNPTKCARIDALLRRLGWDGKSYDSRVGERFWTLGPRLSAMLLARVPTRTLTIGALLDLDRPALDRLREAMLLGDGTQGAHVRLCTGRREQAEAFQVLCTLTGSAASIGWRDMSMYTPRSPKMGNVPRMTGVWTVTILRRDTAQVTHEQRREIVGKVPVWCPVVPNTFFVARRSGHVFVTGNTPVQGTAADYATTSLADAVDWIEGEGLEEVVKLVLPVHDALIFDVRADMVRETVEVARDIMLSHDSFGVALAVDCEVGPSWGSLVPYKEAA
jgi:uracil-DNA glycosylase family 4